jgi:hypothetical protein
VWNEFTKLIFWENEDIAVKVVDCASEEAQACMAAICQYGGLATVTVELFH